MRSSRSASFSEGSRRDLAWMPVLRAFMEEAALPVTELGPVDFWALRRLASIWRSVDMVTPGVGPSFGQAGGPSYFEDRTADFGIRGGGETSSRVSVFPFGVMIGSTD